MASAGILLSTAYLPPVQYVAKLLRCPAVMLESSENFVKQTYRNRALILTANGPEALVIPVEKQPGLKCPVRDVKISYYSGWQRVHWQAIVSAYGSSPFFEILGPDFRPFYRKKFKFLFDFNLRLLEVIFDILEITPDMRLTERFEEIPEGWLNFRESIQPKKHRSAPDPDFVPEPYDQVFGSRYGFVSNLSIIDLLFNGGSESYEILLKSTRQD